MKNEGQMKTIKFSEIVVDENMSTRPTTPHKVARLAELISIGDYPPPVTVRWTPEGYLLLDGFNRHAAWTRALNGEDFDIPVNVVDCPDEKTQFVIAIEANIGSGDNYTPEQLNSLYYRLVWKEGFSRSEAKKLLHMSNERTEKIEIIRMKADREEERAAAMEATVSFERADLSETTVTPERAGHPEEPVTSERARLPEDTIRRERAVVIEESRPRKRAVVMEQTGPAERAVQGETPAVEERARISKPPMQRERIPINHIIFHVTRLSELIPGTWEDAVEALELLKTAIQTEAEKIAG